MKYYYKIIRKIDDKKYSLCRLEDLTIEYKLGKYNFPNLLPSRIFVYSSVQSAISNLESLNSLPWKRGDVYELWRVKAIDPRIMTYCSISMRPSDIKKYWIKWRHLGSSSYRHSFYNHYIGCKAIKLIEQVL